MAARICRRIAGVLFDVVRHIYGPLGDAKPFPNDMPCAATAPAHQFALESRFLRHPSLPRSWDRLAHQGSERTREIVSNIVARSRLPDSREGSGLERAGNGRRKQKDQHRRIILLNTLVSRSVTPSRDHSSRLPPAPSLPAASLRSGHSRCYRYFREWREGHFGVATQSLIARLRRNGPHFATAFTRARQNVVRLP